MSQDHPTHTTTAPGPDGAQDTWIEITKHLDNALELSWHYIDCEISLKSRYASTVSDGSHQLPTGAAFLQGERESIRPRALAWPPSKAELEVLKEVTQWVKSSVEVLKGEIEEEGQPSSVKDLVMARLADLLDRSERTLDWCNQRL